MGTPDIVPDDDWRVIVPEGRLKIAQRFIAGDDGRPSAHLESRRDD